MAARLGNMFGAIEARTLLGVREIDALSPPPDLRAAVLGVDTVTPYANVGPYCTGGATAIRAGAADFAANLNHVNFDFDAPSFPASDRIGDGGDLATDPSDPAGNRSKVKAATQALLANGSVPVLVGGEDSLPIPLLQGMESLENLWVVQIDAHLDWRDEVQGERFGLSSPMRRASEMSHVAGIVQIGLRGIGSARESDRADALAWGAHLYPMRHVAQHGFAEAIAAVPEGADIALIFDWDALDPSIMPSVIARTPGGLDYWTAFAILEALCERGRIRGVSFAEFVAPNDIDGLGARTAAELLISTLGLIARA